MPSKVANLMGDEVCTGNQSARIVTSQPTTANVKVAREGKLVLLTIGGGTIRMEWKTAMMIGQWLMSRGVEAKFLDGDSKRLLIEKDRNGVA